MLNFEAKYIVILIHLYARGYFSANYTIELHHMYILPTSKSKLFLSDCMISTTNVNTMHWGDFDAIVHKVYGTVA